MGGYKEKTIRLDFGDLGKGCYAVIKNPALLPLEMPVRIDPELPQADQDAALIAAGKERIGALITEWCMWDVDSDAELPLPKADPGALDRCPAVVLNRIGEEVQKRTNPTPAPATPTSKS